MNKLQLTASGHNHKANNLDAITTEMQHVWIPPKTWKPANPASTQALVPPVVVTPPVTAIQVFPEPDAVINGVLITWHNNRWHHIPDKRLKSPLIAAGYTVSTVDLYIAVKEEGDIIIIAVKQPYNAATKSPYNSLTALLSKAMGQWLKISRGEKGEKQGSFVGEEIEGLEAPQWPEPLDVDAVLNRAFKGCIIDQEVFEEIQSQMPLAKQKKRPMKSHDFDDDDVEFF